MEGEISVAILGAGMMGAEIALCFAAAGYPVIVKELDRELAHQGKLRMEQVLVRAVRKGRFQEIDKGPTLARIRLTDTYEALSNVSLVVEAITEDLAKKTEIFRELDEVCKPQCVFASNTSSISITRLAAAVNPARRRRFIGTHFFSPAFVMKLVEVVPGLETDEPTRQFVLSWCSKIGKSPILVKDVTGFVVNRILHAMWLEAMRLLEEQAASAEDIDTACRLGLGHPIGPFELMDLTSNDLNLRVQEILYEAYGERFRPSQLLRQKVFANHLGRKTGQGWFPYKKDV